MPHYPDPAITTDVFDYLMGEVFVMVDMPVSTQPRHPQPEPPREAWAGIEDDVRELERLFTSVGEMR
jgi:hypothetical protein